LTALSGALKNNKKNNKLFITWVLPRMGRMFVQSGPSAAPPLQGLSAAASTAADVSSDHHQKHRCLLIAG